LAVLAARSAAPASAQAAPTAGASARREVIKQALPGKSDRIVTLVEVTYPPGNIGTSLGLPLRLYGR
jgi:hypothetical protein